MTKFYTDVFIRGNNVYIRGYENNNKIQSVVPYKPYLFIPKKDGKYSTLDGKDVIKYDFDTIKEAKDFLLEYNDVANFDIYGLDNFTYLYIYDNYPGEIKFDVSKISIVSLDIECAADEGFPDIGNADKEITAITIRKQGHSYVFGCGDFVSEDKNVSYVKCKDEVHLLTNFLKLWNFKSIQPDIITGWNIEFFDIPYLVNRIRKILGEDSVKALSPWKMVDEKVVEFRGKENKTYILKGIATLDYYQLYRKFTFGNQESYKLDYIALVELGEKKLDYSEYGSLLELYKNNYQKFIEYNIRDVVLVDKLEDKLKFIEQVVTFAYDAKVNYNDTLTTVRPWDIIIHNYLLDRRIVIPVLKKSSNNDNEYSIVGGYVKEPKLGLSKWVVSFDLNSLYPHLIMQYNISPEMFIGKSANWFTMETLLTGNFDVKTEDPDLKYTHTANGCAYRKDRQGFLPALMEKMYNDRVEYKKKMIEAKKEYEKTKNKDLEKDIARYHNLQLAKKIQLNSAYGALGNKYFRWFNNNHAEAITMSGQLSIRWIENKINKYLNKVLKSNNVDYVIASDTDSIYVNMEPLVSHLDIEDEMTIVKAIDTFCEKKVQPFINDCYQELSVLMNAYQQKMYMKRETIANKGIWKAKKMYILNAWNVEGVQYEKPKLKIQGIEAVRSSTPQACRESIKKALNIIMNENEEALKKYVKDFREEFMNLPFDQIAFPRGVNGIKKYYDKYEIYKLGTPIHVKGALLFNYYLLKYNINYIPPIMDGDKIKFVWLKLPNPIHDTVISTADYLPKEFNIDNYIDRDKQFEKSFLEPLKSITDVIGWQPEYKATLF